MKKRNLRILVAALLVASTALPLLACQSDTPPVNSDPDTTVEQTTEASDTTPDETDAKETEPATEAVTDAVTDAVTEPVTEEETEPETEPVTEEETEPETEPSATAPAEVVWPKKNIFFGGSQKSVKGVQILAGNSESEQYAARELQKYLEKMKVSVQEDGELVITIQTDASLGEDAYRITTGDTLSDGMTITGGNSRGVLYAVYDFLEEMAGIRFYTPVLETCNNKPISLAQNMNMSYTPVFELRQHQWGGNTAISGWEARNNPEWCVKNKINMNMLYGDFSEEMGGSWKYGLWCHTMTQLTGCPSTSQPCLTDPENLEKAIAEVRRVLAADPNVNAVSVGQNDNYSYCTCDNAHEGKHLRL